MKKKYSYIFHYQDSVSDGNIDFDIQSYNKIIDNTIKYSSTSATIDGSYYGIITDSINPSKKIGIINTDDLIRFKEPNDQELLYDLHLVDQLGNSKDIIIQVGGSKVDPRLIEIATNNNVPKKTNKLIPIVISASVIIGVFGFLLIGARVYSKRKYKKMTNI